jgi:hypothetical protein
MLGKPGEHTNCENIRFMPSALDGWKITNAAGRKNLPRRYR